jgi:hypothetical protein
MSRELPNKYSNRTASALIKTGSGRLVGMYVNSTTSGTIKFWDNTSAATTVIFETITPSVGWHDLGNVAFNVGLYATIANTLNVTLVYE